MNEIESKIQEIKNEIKSLEEKVKRINVLENQLRILEEAKKIVVGISQMPPAPVTFKHKNGSNRPEITILDLVETILNEAGHALHLTEINKKLLSNYGKKVHKYSVASGITRSIGKGEERFTRTQPNTFGLEIWKKRSDDDIGNDGLKFSAPK